MSGATVDVQGADALAGSLRRLGKDLTDWSAVNAAAGAAVAADAKRRAPHRTGALAGSIAATSSSDGANIAAGARYARYVEYGTRRRAARPYLHPALQAADVIPLYQAQLDRAVSNVKGA